MTNTSGPVSPPRGSRARELIRDAERVPGEIGRFAERFAGPVEEAASHFVHSPQAEKTVQDLLAMALDEITRNQAAAAAAAEKLIADARADAAQILVQARQEAASLAAGAREQSDALLSSARAQAKSMLDGAAAQAAAVHEGAERRLDQLVSFHDETTRRLQQIHQMTGQAMTMEAERGPLAGEVDRALAGTAAVAASADVLPPAPAGTGPQPRHG